MSEIKKLEPELVDIKPITPEEVIGKKPEIPGFVILAFNELIQKKWNKSRKMAIVCQEEAIKMIMEKAPIDEEHPFKRSDIFDKHYLDVEDLYIENGWDVKYTKQPYYETKEDHYFTFRKKESED